MNTEQQILQIRLNTIKQSFLGMHQIASRLDYNNKVAEFFSNLSDCMNNPKETHALIEKFEQTWLNETKRLES
ncbi:hypothetical protein [Helicobacter cetorum]|uniref:Uncharacterized protein n=1 Tax=Helicobacter cetorum (strain ATCC BAA-540 / CCUG 52418 / MIT 99-5656) TaxID=1163745 RepID=I0EUM5_HELCM|nr:hypothetical protein [Helicobacter cetorum]AFI06507.1 hypothetical protein HCD_07600 [Helicobacter cetorum MIT 99-5656]AFI06644.1 hypothetical protein HCD_08310 [Helicobacter cetorum MIT 99-5656]